MSDLLMTRGKERITKGFACHVHLVSLRDHNGQLVNNTDHPIITRVQTDIINRDPQPNIRV